MTSGPAFRLARAAVFAAVCVVATALGHALMSGAPLPWWAVAYAFAATSAAAWWLTGRERGAVEVTAATVTAQLALHELFGLAQRVSAPGPARMPLTATSPPTSTSMSMGGDMAHMAHPMPSAPASGHAAMPDEGVSHWIMSVFGHSGSGMFLAHLTAALLCALWLWRGEAAAFRTGRALAAAVFVPLRLVPPPQCETPSSGIAAWPEAGAEGIGWAMCAMSPPTSTSMSMGGDMAHMDMDVD
ncbi:hypothetical protein, partial [Streptomyces flavofungini]|uniref:hypothetical protein n=1 Tax=Streptomyces flavofungini TaxID=68200 RepID=UPI0034DE382E